MHSSRMLTVRRSSRLLGGGLSASVHSGIYTPPPGFGHPPAPGLDLDSPQAWAWTPPGQTPPGLDLDTPPWTDTCENITFANFVCGQ